MLGRPAQKASALILLALTLLLPASTAAASPYRVIVRNDICTDSGGAHRRGYVALEVKAKEVGRSGTNYFVIKSKLQWSSGLGYSTKSTWPDEISSNFPDNDTDHYRITQRRYDFTKNDVIGYRIVIKVQFWSNSRGLLATKTIFGIDC